MITKEGMRIIIRCDACAKERYDQPNVQRPRFRLNKDVWKDAQAEGWTAKEKGKDWNHFCAGCSAH